MSTSDRTDDGPPSMVKTGIYKYERNRMSDEFFSPGPQSTLRTASLSSAVFNLVSTIIGGGVLSLPYAFDKCGIVLAVFFMLLCAAAANFSLYVLVSSSRRGRAKSYEEVVRAALGEKAGTFALVILVLLTFTTLIAYAILTKDFVTSLGSHFIFGREVTTREANVMTIVCITLISPMLFARTMDALRFTSVMSLLSVLILAIAVVTRAVQSVTDMPMEERQPLKIWPTSWLDALYAFPIISVSFQCHFNVLPVYRELHKPTRRRLKLVVSATVFSSWLFYLVVGAAGYLFAYQMPEGVQGDILQNFDVDDLLINVGRFGLLVTILLSMPLVIQPCRTNTLHLIKKLLVWWKTRSSVTEEERQSLMNHVPNGGIGRTSAASIHVILTVGIIVSVLALALILPGVAVVWNVMGSTVGLMVSYVLPCISYVYIRTEKPQSDSRKVAAWTIFVCSAMLSVMCTVQSFAAIF